jgi:hypothetical protein
MNTVIVLYGKMIMTPELAGILASAMGLFGLIVRKARCFARRVGGKWQYGVGFSEKVLIPEIKQDINIQMGYQRPPVITDVSSDPTPLGYWGGARHLPSLSKRK